MKKFLVAAAMLGGLIAAEPASALPMGPLPGVGESPVATDVALYCNARGNCVNVRRPGYVLRRAAPVVRVAPRGRVCRGAYHWNGRACVLRRPGVTLRVR